MLKKKLSIIFARLKKPFKKDPRKLLPGIYFIFLFAAFVLTLLFAAFPSLITCSSIFGTEFCVPTGIYLGLFVSLPGYIILGNIFTRISKLPTLLSFLLIIGVSALFYYFCCLFLDSYRKGNSEKRIKLIIILL